MMMPPFIQTRNQEAEAKQTVQGYTVVEKLLGLDPQSLHASSLSRGHVSAAHCTGDGRGLPNSPSGICLLFTALFPLEFTRVL